MGVDMKSKKMIIFFTVHVSLLIIIIFTLFFNTENYVIICNNVIGSMIILAGIVMGGRVADDFQKGLYYNKDIEKEKDK